ncbi:MAG TPA: hypothetical protein VGV12_13105 [Gemmatimonadales bacterium]|nr:hypothetical protein [Gemmatimonadales bacterium]
MRTSYAIVALAALVSVGCPYSDLLSSKNGGIAIAGGGGGTGSDALRFTVQPSDATAGNIITPAIQVTVFDSLGAPDSTFTNPISIAIGINPVGGTLSGTLSVTPVNAIASFGDLVISSSGAGYTLAATASGATGASSASFTILAP